MTSRYLIGFFEQRPFEPFTLVMASGRELHVMHPENATLGFAGMSAIYQHPTRQVEVIDAELIESIRTIYASEMTTYDGQEPESE